MKLAAARARALGKPWVLDPVGCGATPYRTTARRFLPRRRQPPPPAAAAAQPRRPATLCPCFPGSQVCRELLELRPAVVRGNASEIMALAGVRWAAVCASACACARACARACAWLGGVGRGIQLVELSARWQSQVAKRPAAAPRPLPARRTLTPRPATHRPCRASATTKGVDSTAAAHEALEAGRDLAAQHGCVVAIR